MTEHVSTQRRVLIVDDVEDNRNVLERHLRRAGFATDTAVDGMSALAMVTESQPDVVLLDWMMPGLSGLETLRAMREKFDENELPIIMCTALGEETTIVDAIKAGANDYVMKPISMPILMVRMKSQLARKDVVELLRRENSELESSLVQRTRDLLNVRKDPA
ncbi:response regulator transcription factor [Brevundimonas sp. VNH65]|uniref:response regulator transcription factor n=1 Tax=Brevundimonas sp. VNH65 TaxID=3400917 RepID=UPI003C1018F9